MSDFYPQVRVYDETFTELHQAWRDIVRMTKHLINKAGIISFIADGYHDYHIVNFAQRVGLIDRSTERFIQTASEMHFSYRDAPEWSVLKEQAAADLKLGVESAYAAMQWLDKKRIELGEFGDVRFGVLYDTIACGPEFKPGNSGIASLLDSTKD